VFVIAVDPSLEDGLQQPAYQRIDSRWPDRLPSP
jgi:hypothetical protein